MARVSVATALAKEALALAAAAQAARAAAAAQAGEEAPPAMAEVAAKIGERQRDLPSWLVPRGCW